MTRIYHYIKRKMYDEEKHWLTYRRNIHIQYYEAQLKYSISMVTKITLHRQSIYPNHFVTNANHIKTVGKKTNTP